MGDLMSSSSEPVSVLTPSVLLLLATLTPHRAPSPIPRLAAHIQQRPVCTRNHSSRSARPVSPAPRPGVPERP